MMPFFYCILSLFVLISQAGAQTITADTVWQGEVVLDHDVLVPAGRTLTIKPGTRVKVVAAVSTKTDPEYLSPLNEIMVRGKLIVEGTAAAPVVFCSSHATTTVSWAGIIIDSGKAVIRSAVINDADTGVLVLRGMLDINDTVLTKNRYGIVLSGKDSSGVIAATRITANEYGVVRLNGAVFETGRSLIEGNRKKDTYTAAAKDVRLMMNEYRNKESKAPPRVYQDAVIQGTVVWEERVEVRGTIRVPERSRLIVLPGTIVEFRRNDTNGDGIGENGLLIQGTLIAKGTKERPILFRSGEKKPQPGDWDAINIMNSDQTQNLVEFCQIEDAYRGLHFHFSNVAVVDSVLRNNYRGIQFQESIVSIRGTHIYRNKSGVQARDSEIAFSDNMVYRNDIGLNLLRNSITFSGNLVLNNAQEGLRMREGLPVVEGNLFDGNRFGLLVSDAQYGTYRANVVSNNLETGIALKGSEGIEISGNAVQGNGITGLALLDAGADVRNNVISDNGDRGIGIQSFQGVITANNIIMNERYNLGIDGDAPVSAPGNFWGRGDAKKTIFDKENDPAKGQAFYLPLLDRPVPFAWPLRTIWSDTKWHGPVLVRDTVSVEAGALLELSPSTRVLFSQGSGLTVRGVIRARGERESLITFAAAGDGMVWNEILIDKGSGSMFSFCSFENATWALHSHFTDLTVDDCTFRNNHGGLRFTGGPVAIKRSLLEQNEIGIRSYRGIALITENRITGNKVGIFVREKGGGLTVNKNDIVGNSDYAIRLGDFNTEDVDARNNWWGSLDPTTVIYDARLEPEIGFVRFEPAAAKPFTPVSEARAKGVRKARDK